MKKQITIGLGGLFIGLGLGHSLGLWQSDWWAANRETVENPTTTAAIKVQQLEGGLRLTVTTGRVFIASENNDFIGPRQPLKYLEFGQ